MKVTVKLNRQVIEKITKDAAIEAAEDTLEAVYQDLKDSKTMPFDVGNMQNNETSVGSTEDGAVLFTGSIQARRLYYHPEYNFQQKEGANGTRGAKWLEPYLTGNKKDFIKDKFTESLRRRIGK